MENISLNSHISDSRINDSKEYHNQRDIWKRANKVGEYAEEVKEGVVKASDFNDSYGSNQSNVDRYLSRMQAKFDHLDFDKLVRREDGSFRVDTKLRLTEGGPPVKRIFDYSSIESTGFEAMKDYYDMTKWYYYDAKGNRVAFPENMSVEDFNQLDVEVLK